MHFTSWVLCCADADGEEDRELQRALWLSSQQAQPHDADPQGFRSCGNAEPGMALIAFLDSKWLPERGQEGGWEKAERSRWVSGWLSV